MADKKPKNRPYFQKVSPEEAATVYELVMEVTPAGKKVPVRRVYSLDSPSETIVTKSMSESGVCLTPEQYEFTKESVERGRGLGRGFKFSAKFLDLAEVSFEIPSREETRTTEKATFKKEED